ncbi:MAG: hypothetical protein H6727_10390 [Myxococcales bacterium]|nr:hypothetical protein [Myxococcales bacterium]
MLRESLGTFLFDAFEGLGELEGLFLEQRVAWEWVLHATQKDRREGWLERGLYQGASWQEDFFSSLFQLAGAERDEGTKRDLYSKIGELLVMLPQTASSGEFLHRLCQSIELLPKETDKSWLIGELSTSCAGVVSKSWREKCFFCLLEALQSLADERQRSLGILRFVKGMSEGVLFEAWSFKLFEELFEELSSFREKYRAQESSLFLHEKLLGHEKLHPEWARSERVGTLSLRCLLLANTNHVELRGRYLKRLRFVWEEIKTPQKIEKEWLEEALKSHDTLEGWEHQEYNLDGVMLWEQSGRAALLRLLVRAFCEHEDISWKREIFGELLERIRRIKKVKERRELMRAMAEMLHRSQEEDEHEEMLMTLFRETEPFGVDISCVYEGLAWSYLELEELHDAEESIRKVEDPSERDKLYRKTIELYLQWSRPEQAISLLSELFDTKIRGEVALLCARSRAVGEDPLACAMLCEEALIQTEETEQVLTALLQNPFLSPLAKKDFLREGLLFQEQEEYLGQLARKERLKELERLKAYLPQEVYRSERKELLGLLEKESIEKEGRLMEKPKKEKEKKSGPVQEQEGIMLDLPHRYGDHHYISPKDHVEKNHFSRDVGGSVFTLWPSFQDMWDDVEERVLQEVEKRGDAKLWVIDLSFPVEVGLTGVIPLEKAHVEALAVEERNGQPSLFCGHTASKQPTKFVTFVVGESLVSADAIEGYEGHHLSRALYTAYPGQPSFPFPRCERGYAKDLREGLERAIVELKEGRVRQAKKTLLHAYQQLDGEEEWAHYWSEHVLVR